jgi:hypothetical protein
MSESGEGTLPPTEGCHTPLQALALIRKDLFDHEFADSKINRLGLQFFTGKFSQLEDLVQASVFENAVLKTKVQEKTATLATLAKIQVRTPDKEVIKTVARPSTAEVRKEGRRPINYASAV